MKADPGDDPERRLGALSASLQRLRPFLNKEDGAVVADLLAQTLATQLLHGMDLLAVAGRHGAGKTTLLRELYGEDVGPWLSDNPGRGEKLPIVVLEDPDQGETSARLHLLPEQASGAQLLQVAEDVDLTAWAQALAGSHPPAVLAELRVPPRLFGGAERGFVGVRGRGVRRAR